MQAPALLIRHFPKLQKLADPGGGRSGRVVSPPARSFLVRRFFFIDEEPAARGLWERLEALALLNQLMRAIMGFVSARMFACRPGQGRWLSSRFLYSVSNLFVTGVRC